MQMHRLLTYYCELNLLPNMQPKSILTEVNGSKILNFYGTQVKIQVLITKVHLH